MKFDLPAIIRRTKPGMRRKRIVIRDIAPPAVLATDLYQAAYAPMLAVWERALPRVMPEYERTLAGMTRDSAADIGNEIGGIGAELQRLFLLLTPELQRWALRVESWQRGKWRGAVLSATGVDIGTLVGPEDARETLGAFVERNVALVKNVSAEVQGRISDAVFRGLSERKPAAEVAKEIADSVEGGRKRAKRIASDQLAKAASALSDERRRDAGISLWKWRHSGKLHPRKQHVARNGKVYADTATGSDPKKDVLPPPDDRPGQLPFCGCRAQSVIDLD